MSGDIVVRLRELFYPDQIEWEAADAIEKLRADLAAERAEVERLTGEVAFWEREHQREQDAWRAERALADQLAHSLLDHSFRGDRRDRMYGSSWEPVHDALDAYEETRREHVVPESVVRWVLGGPS